MNEPRDDADRALLARLLDLRDDVRVAAVADWDAARMASSRVADAEPRVEWPRRSADERGAWETDDDSTPVSPGHALYIAFENRTRALTRGLVSALRGGDAPTRAAAASSMGAMWLHTGKHLTDALADPAAEVRVAAAQALSSQARFESSYPACFHAMVALLVDPDWRVRQAALRGMLAYRDDDARNESWGVRMGMSRLLATTRDARAEVRVAALSMVDAAQEWTRQAADVPGIFAEALADPDPAVRSRAARFFAEHAERGDADPAPPAVVAMLRGMLAAPTLAERYAAAFAVWRTTHDASAVVGIYAEQVAETRGTDLIDPLRLLAEIGPDAEAAVPAILSVLTEDTYARKGNSSTVAMDALYAIGPPPATTLPLLRAMLEEADAGRRAEAARAIVTLDGDDAAREAALAGALSRETDPSVRGAIHTARGAIGAGGDALVADLVRGLSTSDHEPWGETWGAIEGVRLMGPKAAAAMPALEALVPFDEELTNRPQAAAALAVIGGPSRAVEMLIRLRGSDVVDVARIVCSVGPADAAIVPALLRHLDESPFVISRALAEIGPAAKDALPALDLRLHGPSAEESVAAGEAVLRIGGDREAALKVLVAAIDSTAALHELRSDEDLGTEAVYALGRSGAAARPAVAALRHLAEQEGGKKSHAAAFALWHITGEVEPCIEAALVAVQRQYGSATSPDLVESLGAIGPAAARATSTLVSIALECQEFSWQDQWKGSEIDVCRAAIRALGQIGAGAASALPTLRRLRRNALFRAAAEEAIRRIE